MKRQLAETLKQRIETILDNDPANDDDKLHCAVLAEIRDRLYVKLIKHQTDYTISFTPAQAFALRILYTDYINNPTCYLGNKLQVLAVEVHKQFN
jgi:hypothetical protein